jgi:dipeptidyl aminopeptidase/acylaminoacyl peptidase
MLRLAMLLLTVASSVSASPFTIEQVMSAPFPSQLVASPKGDRVSWAVNDRGARNVWVAEAPAWTGRAVTSFPDDDGLDLSDLAFAPDGRSLVFVRGEGRNGRGELANPLSLAGGGVQEVWIAPVSPSGAEPRRLADGHGPAVSPKDGRIAFVLKDEAWWIGPEPGAKPEQPFHARGRIADLRWSPDGTRLAFVSRRGDHSYVGVFDTARGALVYLDPGVDRDGEPAWSPDGRRIAFLRIPAVKESQIFRPQREGTPWSIRVGDAETGASRPVFRAEAGRGSVFRETAADAQLFWVDGDRILFPWERDGWTHLYAIPAGGGAPSLLTPGQSEVEWLSLTPDRRTVLYNSNEGDIDRRHLWSVSVAGGPPRPLTRGDGIEWLPAGCADGSVAFIHSDARRPPRPAIRTAAGVERDIAPGAVPADFPEASLVTPEGVVFPAADGLSIHGQLFLPRDGSSRGTRHPALLYFHGGSRRQMVLGWNYRYYYRNAYALNQYLASRGFVVLSVNYRSGIGYGLDFREASDYGASGASEYRDVLGAAQYLRSRADVDPKRIGLWGGSYGGYLTALGLARNSDLFAAGVDFHGVHDWTKVIGNFEPEYDPKADPEAARLAFRSSPMADIATWRSPVLLIHGDDDRNVPFAESVSLAEALRKKGVDVEELVFADEIHDFLVHRHWIEAYRRTAEFLERRLKP